MNTIHKFAALIAGVSLSLTASAEFQPLKVTPADNSTVERLSKITTEWPGEWLDDQTDDICGVVKDAEGTELTTITCEIDFLDPICDFYLAEPVTADGTYTVVIYAESVQSDEGEWNSEFELHYTIGEGVAAEPLRFVEADPANFSVVTSLSGIETTWSETVAEINQDLVVEVLDSTGTLVAEMEARKSIFSSSPTVYLSLASPIEKDGVYTIVIPEGLLTTENGGKSEAQELTYTVDILSAVSQIGQSSDIEIHGRSITYNGSGSIWIIASDGCTVANMTKGTTTLGKGTYIIRTTDSAKTGVRKIRIL